MKIFGWFRNTTVAPGPLPLGDLDRVHLVRGGAHDRGFRICLMELVSWIAGLDHTAHPRCTSSLVADRLMIVNDRIQNNRDRQRLKEIAPLLVNFHPDDKILALGLLHSGLEVGRCDGLWKIETVDQAITFVRITRAFMDGDLAAITAEDERFLAQVEHGEYRPDSTPVPTTN